uniref:FUN14 domain-containing protein 1 n=1 Tax=Leptobrachium leishanense TaxID=445787 RepID=A0A8C5QSH2_9ANUR
MAARRDPSSEDESYKVLDITEYARRHHWWRRLFGHNSGPLTEKYSVATQIVMGGVTVGKLAATAVGGGFLLLQIASHSGYVQIDWKRVEKDNIKKMSAKVMDDANALHLMTRHHAHRPLRGRGALCASVVPLLCRGLWLGSDERTDHIRVAAHLYVRGSQAF